MAKSRRNADMDMDEGEGKRVRKPGDVVASGRVHDEEEHEGNLKFEVRVRAVDEGDNPTHASVKRMPCSPMVADRCCASLLLREQPPCSIRDLICVDILVV